MSQRPQFLFVTCQVGAELALKGELARRWPDFHLAFSRPGFLTFKLPADHKLLADFNLESVFARAYGFSLGGVTGDSPDELARAVWGLYEGRPFRRLHVWSRDTAAPGEHGFEPGPTPESAVAWEAILRGCPRPEELGEGGRDPRQPARRGDFVLDCILVDPGRWWVGYHRAGDPPSCWSGGSPPLELPKEAVSRAWLKVEEGLLWSQLPIPQGARVAELGSAPGGASQALLSRGLIVLGIDPAEMHPTVLAHPNFTHVRRRSTQVRRREFRKIRWLLSDMNVAPNYTLDALETIVTHPEVNVRGILATLKLPDWQLADRVPDYLDRVRSWGFNVVQARQLLHNRQEICFAGLMRPFVRKAVRRRGNRPSHKTEGEAGGDISSRKTGQPREDGPARGP